MNMYIYNMHCVVRLKLKKRIELANLVRVANTLT